MKGWEEWSSNEAHVSQHTWKRGHWADGSENNAAPSANSVGTVKKDRDDDAMAADVLDNAVPLVTVHPMLCSSWLKECSQRLSSYDAKLLYRYIPSLPATSLQNLVDVCHSEQEAYIAMRKRQGGHVGVEEEASKMAMRRILADTFARLAPADTAIQEILRHWTATDSKAKRKGMLCAQKHTAKWHESGQHPQ